MKEWNETTLAIVWLFDCVAIGLWLFCKGKPK